MNGAFHDDDIQELFESDGFEIASQKLLTEKEWEERLDNFIAFSAIYVNDARQSASELMALSSAKLLKETMVKLTMFNKSEVVTNTRRYIDLVLDYGAESVGIMECAPFGTTFITDPTTRHVISNFKAWILTTVEAAGTLPDTREGFMFLTREVKHELNEVAWILLEAAHRTAIQLKLFMSYFDKTLGQ